MVGGKGIVFSRDFESGVSYHFWVSNILRETLLSPIYNHEDAFSY